MRQRVTYLLPSGTGADPSDITLDQSSLTFSRDREASEERRITVGLDELPEELRLFLQDFHELHIRVANPQNYVLPSPALSRLPPGFHAFFTPRTPTTDTRLCPVLKQLLGQEVKCSDSSDSFSKPPILSERFAAASTYQFFSHVNAFDDDLSLSVIKEFGDRYPTGSVGHAAYESIFGPYIQNAANFDFDFDVITHTLTLTVLWSRGHPPSPVYKHAAFGRLEVGILSPEEPQEPEELSMGGFLTIVGEDDHPSATLFSFPSRNHPLPPSDDTTYTARFQQPTGLHPKLDITFPTKPLHPPKDTCALHAYWTLPSSLFIDRYQLSDDLFLQSQNLVSLRAISGEQDLEAPDWAISGWGSAALLELATPDGTEPDETWTVTIPTHLRYLNTEASPSGHADVTVPWPIVFWACTAEEGLKMSTNPFDRVNLGYDGLFGPKTMFYHVPPGVKVKMLTETLKVPVLDPSFADWVPLGTLIAVLLGFAWVCAQLLKGGRSVAAARRKSE